MIDGNIILERKDGIAVVTLDRPDRHHSFNDRMFDLMEEITADLRGSLPRAVVITGSGARSFSAGFDVQLDNPMMKRLIDAVTTKNEALARESIVRIHEVMDAFTSLPVPIIAALNGNAFGGGAELAVRCDLRVMARNAVICFSEVTLGLMPDHGGGAALPRLVGASRAADLILTARRVGAEEALAMGLANRICESGYALGEALATARLIADNGPRAVRHALELIRGSRNRTYEESLAEEVDRAASLIASGECIHGVSAFLEKRRPSFPDI
ncbi:MAG: enoyl-CoA hydratase/isomerase family protein [Spirochaetes bacterium]|nr:enoyl-CoA hydratase/isomerase family protein [Spirochaetota bacterium]